jgi:16S rRNA (cytidine1402-2'-O)-methyltransferase
MPATSWSSKGLLYLVATPIGNLEDISARALRLLSEVDVIAAEDTRETRKLLSHFKIKTPLHSYHEHSGEAATTGLGGRMLNGSKVALVTDAGTPGISDPGVDLVQASISAGIIVVPIPGPSAVITAIVASGLPPARFVFEGFLPRTKSSRITKLKYLSSEVRTVVFYEAPQRMGETLAEVATLFGAGRKVCVARELTKKFEEFRRGTAEVLAEHYAAEPPRGECTIVVEGAPEGFEVAEDEAKASEGRNDLIKQLAADMGINRRDLYKAIQALKETKE